MPRAKTSKSTTKQGTHAATKATAKKTASKRDPNEALAEASRAQDARQAKKKAQAKKKQAKKAAAKAGNGSYGRKHALYRALAKGGTRNEVTEELNRRYVKNGGSDNPTNSRNWVSTFVPILIHFGAVKEDDNGRLKLTK